MILEQMVFLKGTFELLMIGYQSSLLLSIGIVCFVFLLQRSAVVYLSYRVPSLVQDSNEGAPTLNVNTVAESDSKPHGEDQLGLG